MNTNNNTTDTTNNVTPAYEETHAARCLHIYLNNTADIYDRYTVPAIEQTAAAFKYRNGAKYTPAEYWDVLERAAKDMHAVKSALQAAARLVKKHDHMTPTAADIEFVTADYVAYIIECAQYEVANV